MKCADHEVFTTEDDPEAEERGVEDALLDVLKQQHPRPLEAQREPLHRHVQDGHGDTQGKNHPGKGKSVLQLLILALKRQVTLCCRQSIDLVPSGPPCT